MKLGGPEASRSWAKPEAACPGWLIFGADPMRVALRRQEAIAALIGPEGEAEMRLTRISAAELRKDAALLGDALREVGFFPGPRAVFVEDATDGLTDTIQRGLADWRAGDARLVVTAGGLTGKSALKTLFEKHPRAGCLGLYDTPPTREEIESELARAGLRQIDPAAMTDLATLARAIDPGDFRQTLEKIALYKFNDPTPLVSAEVAALAPATIEAEVDDLVLAVAERQARAVAPLMRRLEGQGVAPVTLCIGALRHFRSLHIAATDPGGVQAGLLKARAFGPRRDAMQRQVQNWSVAALERQIADLVETDLTLRSASRAPAMAVIERTLLRIAMTRAR